MSLSRLWGFLAVALPVLAGLIATVQTVDLAYHLRAGGQILDTGAIPGSDAWTFTAAGLPWTDQQWGAQAIFAAIYRVGGWPGLVLLRGALVGVVFGCVFLIARRLGMTARTSALLTLAAFVVAAPALALRPQLIGMALFAVTLLLVGSRRDQPRALWAVPLVAVAWANVHGSFFLAPIVLGFAWLEDVHDGVPRRQDSLAAALASAVLASATPFGSAVWGYAIGLSTNPQVTARITEWQRTTPLEPAGLLFYASVAAVGLLVVRRWGSTPWPTLLWLTVFAGIGAYAVRGIAWWSLGAVIPVAGVLAAAMSRARRAEPPTPALMRRLNALVAALLVVVGVAVLPVWRAADPRTGAPDGVLANAPPGITAALRAAARPGDRLLNPQVWGSWFELALPDLPVAIDSRIEFFPVDVWDTYDLIEQGGPGWENALARWGVTMAVVRSNDADLLGRLTAAGWFTAFSDADGSVLLGPGR